MFKKRSRKQILFIVIVIAVVLVLLAMVVGFIFSSKYAGKISRIFLDLNPFKPEQKPGGNKSDLGTPSSLNETEGGGGGGTTPAAGTSAEAEEVTYGSGALEIKNWVSDTDFDKGLYYTINRQGGTESYGSFDRRYCNSSCLFSPAGKSTKIISRITGYELLNDVRPLTSLSTIYLELSLHSQSGGAITINSTNELRLSLPLAGSPYFYNFSGKTITIQQYDPNDTAASYTSYNVRDVIANDGGVIVLARLDGSYESEVPYAWFKVGFS